MSFVLRMIVFGLLLCARVCADNAVDFQRQSIRIALATEPPNLNSLVSTDQISGFVLLHVMEGLLQYDEHNQLAPGVAERWELRENGATFWLRNNARWSDGKPVTAHDFVFAWRRALLPATASQYAQILFPVKNAERINRGELPEGVLGVRAAGDYRLEVEFERPCPYFLGLTAFVTYLPLREDFFTQRGERYAADNTDLLYNGAFVLSGWTHGARLTMRKNPMYWNARQVQLQEIEAPYFTGDPTAAFNLFQEGSVALATLGTETITDAMERGYALKSFSTGSSYFLEFNMRAGRMTSHHSLRKALQALFSPTELVDKVVGLPGVMPADSFFPRFLKGREQPLRVENPVRPPRRGLQLARDHLAALKAELGVKQLPPLILLTSDSARARREAEYFQQLFSVGLGLDVRIDSQTFKQYLDKMDRGQFDIALAGWGPDFDDPVTFGNLFASWNENNRGHYRSERYDDWVRVAQSSVDPQRRSEAFAALQDLLIEDAPILTTYENAQTYVQHPQLRGVVRAIFGADPNFRFARVVAPGQ